MVVINMFEIVELKKQIQENFGVKLHVHDACYMQSFSFDNKVSDELVEFITKYFKFQKYQVIFSPDGLYFHLEDLK